MRPEPPLIRLLGPVCVVGGAEPARLSGVLPKALFAVLALDPGRPISMDRIAELLWGVEPPAGLKGAVQQLASRVRRGLAPTPFATALIATGAGYVLDVERSSVDLAVFRAQARAAGEAARVGDDHAVISHADDALALWSGRALQDLVTVPVGWQFGPFLDDERWSLEAVCCASLNAVGRSSDAIARLSGAVAAEPTRERLWTLLVSSMLESGQVTEARRTVRAAVSAIETGLGVAPGPQLRDLVRQLDRDSSAGRRPRDPAQARQVMRQQVGQRAFHDTVARAEQALAVGGSAAAVYHWAHALELLDLDDADEAPRQRALLGLGLACEGAGDALRARDAFLEASGIARRRGDAIGFARSVLGYCADHVGFDQPSRQAELLEEAIRTVPVEEHRLRSLLLSRLARERYLTESPDRCRMLAEQALTEALFAGDEDARLEARYSLAYGLWSPMTSQELLQLCEEYLVDALDVGSRRHELLARRWLAHVVTELGHVDRGQHEARLAMELADTLALESQRWMTRVVAASVEIVAGDLARAEMYAQEALAIGASVEPGPSLEYVSILLWNVRWLQGRLDEISTLIEEIADAPGVQLPRRIGLALTYAELGRVEDALHILDEITDADIEAMPVDASWYVGMSVLAEAAALADHRGAARMTVQRLVPFRRRLAVTNMSATGSVAHLLGICRWVLGDREAATEDLREAIDIAQSSGAQVFAARSRAALAVRRCSVEADADAVELARAARREASRLGLVGLARSLTGCADEDLELIDARPADR